MERNPQGKLLIKKTLFLIEHLLRCGSSNIIDFLRDENYVISNLNGFSFRDEKGNDKGETSDQN